MGQAKNYLLNIICACSDQAFGQDAVEYATEMGWVTLTGNFEADVKMIMDQYDDLLDQYRAEVNRNEALLVDSYQPLLDAILERAEDKWEDRRLFPPAA
jgi:hypothetical protein